MSSALFGVGYLFLEMKEVVMSEVQNAVDAVVAQLGKAKEEIVAEIAGLEAAVAAGEVPDLTSLKAAAQALDDVVVDAEVVPE